MIVGGRSVIRNLGVRVQKKLPNLRYCREMFVITRNITRKHNKLANLNPPNSECSLRSTMTPKQHKNYAKIRQEIRSWSVLGVIWTFTMRRKGEQDNNLYSTTNVNYPRK